MKILLMGPQGCGKGTIGEMLSKKTGYPLVSLGDLLRDMPKSHPRYEEVKKLLDEGKLAPFEICADLIMDRVAIDDCRDGYILDGWARDMDNLNFFNPGFDAVLFLKISPEVSVERLSTRRTCSQCGAVYNIKTVPPKVAGVCDVCGGKLIQRDDDTEQAIKKRLSIFEKDTMPVIHHFRREGILIEINAEPMPEEVFKSVVAALKLDERPD